MWIEDVFTIAGTSSEHRLWVSGVNNITYMFATLVCVSTIDRIGRRWNLYWGAAAQEICMFCAGGLARATLNADSVNRTGLGGAATFFVFAYTDVLGPRG
ncbi:hypothetical protein CSUB01_00112 [Colletotrichum sublineola]|uniref:Major facilitator superfamily (MFS) profile domain-containing protein n=1 Tax=Colletotrichum sublineola TaxID=1173701 RepID=A0A066X1L9_COLSU|nr:hypothetical protein CSUB01_00112 [Colletotrichum sublineola]